MPYTDIASATWPDGYECSGGDALPSRMNVGRARSHRSHPTHTIARARMYAAGNEIASSGLRLRAATIVHARTNGIRYARLPKDSVRMAFWIEMPFHASSQRSTRSSHAASPRGAHH